METMEKLYKQANFQIEFDDYFNSSVIIKMYNSYDKNEDHVTIPGYIQGLQVKKIGKNAFEGNDKIKKITIEKGVTIIEDYAFRFCTKLTEIDLPDGLLEIDSWAFYGCNNLEKINFPESIIRISSFAFGDCNKLTGVFIPKGVESLCSDTFSGCSRLKEFIVDDENLEYSSFDGVLFNEAKTILVEYPGGKTEKNYVVPDTVIGIEAGAFNDCKKLITVTLPGGLFDLLTCTFLGCEKLEKVIIKEDNPRFKTLDGVLFDKQQKNLIFYPYGKRETEYVIPDVVERIKECAFSNRKLIKLTNVTFPESLKVIERMAFRGCENLTSIILPKNLKSINSYAFSSCMRLKKVKLSRKTIIGKEAFDNFQVEFDYFV